MKKLFFLLRMYAGATLAALASVVLPRAALVDDEVHEQPEEDREPVVEIDYRWEEKRVPFHSIESYTKELERPQDPVANLSEIANELYRLAEKRKSLVRMLFWIGHSYDENGLTDVVQRVQIEEFRTDRWARMREVQIPGKALLGLAEEFLETMAMHGWESPAGTVSQLGSFAQCAFEDAAQTTARHCADMKVKGGVTLLVSFVANDVFRRIQQPAPHPMVEASVIYSAEKLFEQRSTYTSHFRRRSSFVTT